MKQLIVSLLFITTISTRGNACSCNYGGGFLKMAPNTKMIALVKVIKYLTFKDIYEKNVPMSMEVEVIEVYNGIETRQNIIVWGDPGHLCRPYLSEFKEGRYYIIGFNAGVPGSGQEGEKATDYFIRHCGAYWLNVDFENKVVIGDISKDDRTTQTSELEIFKSDLKAYLEKQNKKASKKNQVSTLSGTVLNSKTSLIYEMLIKLELN